MTAAALFGFTQTLSGSLKQTTLRFLTLFVLFLGAGIALGYPSLSYPFFYDDLHLVRVFSLSEIRGSLTGNWDPDNIETPGYRPGTLLFNHARALLLGENVVMHRLLAMALLAAFLTTFAITLQPFGIQYWQAALGGLLSLASRNNWFSLVWIADGIRPFLALLLALAAWLFLRSLISGKVWLLVASLGLAALALVTREEAVVAFPLVLVPGAVFILSRMSLTRQQLFDGDAIRTALREPQTARAVRLWGVAAGTLIALTAFYLLARTLWVPQAPTPLSWTGWRILAFLVLNPRGQIYGSVTTIWYLVLGFIIGANLVFSSAGVRRRTFFWLGATVVLCAVGLYYPRVNLMLLPITVFSFAVVWMVGNLAPLSRPAFVISLGVVLVMLLVSARDHRIAQQAADPDSLQMMYLNANLVWDNGEHLTIPTERRATLDALFNRYGVRSWNDIKLRYRAMVQTARDGGYDAPNPQGIPFYPRIEFLDP